MVAFTSRKSIVLDHDNLSRTIEKTIDRIEKSHLRGEECALFAEIDRTGKSKTGINDGIRIPRVWPMSNEVKCVGSSAEETPKGKSRHFHPASDDLKQFTLLKVSFMKRRCHLYFMYLSISPIITNNFSFLPSSMN